MRARTECIAYLTILTNGQPPRLLELAAARALSISAMDWIWRGDGTGRFGQQRPEMDFGGDGLRWIGGIQRCLMIPKLFNGRDMGNDGASRL